MRIAHLWGHFSLEKNQVHVVCNDKSRGNSLYVLNLSNLLAVGQVK